MGDERAPAFVRRGSGSSDFLVRARESAGLVSVLEFGLDGWQAGPDLHLHEQSDEMFYVLSGELEMQVGTERHVLGQGDFAWVPRGTAHTFVNATGEPARALTVATPGGLEDFLADQAAYLAGLAGPPDRDELDRLRRRHGGRLLGPPITATRQPSE
ncbi:cupin domain-containing protein [Pseudonocardia sp. CA-107938]|uniref:cupin domain-containing protein n=1 Tax=Pseudonocardia sp. CA-107938 TaxID=3240021 RepID=UPI003D8ABBA4